MPTDECAADNYEQRKEKYSNLISFECEIETAKKWVTKENLKFVEKYPNEIPQPEQTEHYEIIRGLLFSVKNLTARAEQAEARENAMIDFMYAYCQFCEHRDAGEEEEPCCSCENVTHDGRECKWQLLRLPQDGEGK